MSFEMHKQQIHFLLTHEWKKHTSTSVSRTVKLCRTSMTKSCVMTSVKKEKKAR